MKPMLMSLVLLFSCASHSSIRALFHPHDPTLETIGQWINEAQATIDIAMYNMDVTDSSPVIKILKSVNVQNRIHSGDLKVRMVFEGYAAPKENADRMQAIEDLGIDVRFLKKSVKVHHKFAAIDTGLPSYRLVTGSANWSMSSYRSYNENILFFDQEDEVNYRYQMEFNRLWSAAKEFGFTTDFMTALPGQYLDSGETEVYFNSPRSIDPESTEDSNLTEQVVNQINSAKSEILIASTRIRLLPILSALKAAADRGIQIKALISQDDYRDLYKRADYLLKNHNLELRVKFYNLTVSNYIAFQMHNKFMIVDRSQILTGSFNWSDSSENGHIENLVRLSGSSYSEVQAAFENEFFYLWDMGRNDYQPLVDTLIELRQNGQPSPCGIIPMALNISEIRNLIKLSPTCQKRNTPAKE